MPGQGLRPITGLERYPKSLLVYAATSKQFQVNSRPRRQVIKSISQVAGGMEHLIIKFYDFVSWKDACQFGGGSLQDFKDQGSIHGFLFLRIDV
jgi:hypothetical protein